MTVKNQESTAQDPETRKKPTKLLPRHNTLPIKRPKHKKIIYHTPSLVRNNHHARTLTSYPTTAVYLRAVQPRRVLRHVVGAGEEDGRALCGGDVELDEVGEG